MLKLAKSKSNIFLRGLFISSLGSTTFMISILTFLPKVGISAFIIGLIIGVSRISSVVTNFFIGPIGDKLNPRKIVLISEFGAMISSFILLFLSKNLSNDNYFLFTLIIAFRSFFTGLQLASLQKIGKNYDEILNLNGAFSKKMNQVTFGSILFAMLINLFAINNLNFSHIIIFDAVTFFINGILILFSELKSERTNNNEIKNTSLLKTWRLNLKYFELSPDVFILDLILATVMMGANTLNILLLASNKELIPYASGIFGLTVWLSPLIDKKLKVNHFFWWCTLSLSIFCQLYMIQSPFIVLFFSFFRNLSYWQIFNKLSAQIMNKTPKEVFASVSSGRNVGINLIGATGELWTGLQLLNLNFELLLRSILALIGALISNRKKVISLILLFFSLSKTIESNASTLTLPIRSLKLNLDPQLMEDIYSMTVNRQVFSGLMRYSSSLEINLDLADKYEVLDNGKRYRFTLKDSHFSDGSKITSVDILNTFKRILKTDAGIRIDLKSISMFMNPKGDESSHFGVKIISEKVIDFNLDYADPFFLKNLASVDCSVAKLDKNLNLITNVYSGPYSFNSISENEALLTLRNSDTINKPKNIRLKLIKSDIEAIEFAKKGVIDSLDNIEISDTDKKDLLKKGWKQSLSQTVRTVFLTANPENIKTEVRKIIAQKINEIDFSQSLNYATKTYGIIPNLLPGSLSKSDFTIPNLNKKLKTTQKLKLLIPDIQECILISQLLIQKLEKSEIKLEIVKFPLDEYFKNIKNKKYDLILRFKYLDFPDGLSFLTYFKTQTSVNTLNAGTKESDHLIEQAQKESSSLIRNQIYKKIQIEILKDYTFLPLFNGSNQSGLWDNLITYIPSHPTGFSGLNFDEIQVSK
jgi:oligopeptide transport system substrate-binding protein